VRRLAAVAAGAQRVRDRPTPVSGPPAGSLALLAPVDRALLLTLGPAWILCAALAVWRPPIAWPGIVVSGPASRGGYPVVAGFWNGLGAERSGLLPGDELTRIGHAPLAGVGAIGFLARVLEERGTAHGVPVAYRRAGVPGEARLQLAPFPIPLWLYLLVPLTFATMGVVVAVRAHGAGEARCVFHAYAGNAFLLLPWPGGPRVQTYAWLAVTAIGALVVWPLSLRSFLLFPREVAPTRAWVQAAPWGFALLAPSLASWWFGIPLSHDAGFRAVRVLSVAFIIAMLSVALVGYRRAHPVARRKMRWRLYGVSIGMAPIFAVETLGLAYPELPYFSTLHIASILGLIAVPVALTIGIVRYNALDIDRLISATASYSIPCVLALGAAFVLIPQVTAVLSGAIGIERAIGQMGLSVAVGYEIVRAVAGLVRPGLRPLRVGSGSRPGRPASATCARAIGSSGRCSATRPTSRRGCRASRASWTPTSWSTPSRGAGREPWRRRSSTGPARGFAGGAPASM
jgi:hypothetical protein